MQLHRYVAQLRADVRAGQEYPYTVQVRQQANSPRRSAGIPACMARLIECQRSKGSLNYITKRPRLLPVSSLDIYSLGTGLGRKET